jgi:hypothetical protein
MGYRYVRILIVSAVLIAAAGAGQAGLNHFIPEQGVTNQTPVDEPDSSSSHDHSRHNSEYISERDGGEMDKEIEYNADEGERYLNAISRKSSPRWLPQNEVSVDNSVTYEVTRYPYTGPTDEHLDAAWELYNESYEAADERGFFDLENALRDGYKMYNFVRYVNKDYYLDDEELNASAPEGLVYYLNYSANITRNNSVLAGYMYTASGLESEGEQVGGPLTEWHFHTRQESYCLASRLNQGFRFENLSCSEDDVKKKRGPETINVWFIKHPKGPFSADMGTFGRMQQAYSRINGSGGVPEKMTEDEFKSYAMGSYNQT